MSKNQIAPQLRKLRRIERQRALVIDRMLDKTPLLRASLSHVLQRCGTSTCRCAEKPSHPVWRLASSKNGRQRCQLVRKDDVDWVAEYVNRYKDFRQDLRTLDAIQKEEKALLRGLMEIRGTQYE